MIVIVKISLSLIERVIWNHPPRVPGQSWCRQPSGARGAQPPVGSRGKAPVRGGVQGNERSGVPLPKGVRGKSSGLPPAIIADAVGAIIPDKVGTNNSDAVGAIKSTPNQQPNTHLTLNIHTGSARKRGGRVNPLRVDAPPMRASLFLIWTAGCNQCYKQQAPADDDNDRANS